MHTRRLTICAAVLAAVVALSAAAEAGTVHSYLYDPDSSNIGDTISVSSGSPLSVDTGNFATAPNAAGLYGTGRAAARSDVGSVGAYGYQRHALGHTLTDGNGIESTAVFKLDDIVISGSGGSVLASLNMLLAGTMKGEQGIPGAESGGVSQSLVELIVRLNGTTFSGLAEVTASHVEGRYPNVGTSVTGVDSGLLAGVLPTTISAVSGSGYAASYDVSLSTSLSTPQFLLPVGTAFDLEITLRTWTSSGGSGSAGYARTDFLSGGFSFPSGSVLTMPGGYQAISASAGNLGGSAVAVPLPAGLPLGLSGLGMLFLLRRRRSTRGARE